MKASLTFLRFRDHWTNNEAGKFCIKTISLHALIIFKSLSQGSSPPVKPPTWFLEFGDTSLDESAKSKTPWSIADTWSIADQFNLREFDFFSHETTKGNRCQTMKWSIPIAFFLRLTGAPNALERPTCTCIYFCLASIASVYTLSESNER